MAGLAVMLAVGAASANADTPQADAQNAPTASGSGPLEVSIVAETLQVEKSSNGTELRRWRPAARVNAGDEVYYTVRVHNPGKAEVADVVVTKRLPFGVHYLRGSATGPACEVQFSIDDGASFAPAGKLGAAAAGKPRRQVSETDYTHVRWLLSRPLAPGAVALLRFRARFA